MTIPPKSDGAWVRTLPLVRLQAGAPPVIVDLAAYYPGLAGLGRIRGMDGAPPRELDLHTTQAAVGGGRTALVLSGRGERTQNQILEIELQTDGALTKADGTAHLAVEYQAIAPVRLRYAAPVGQPVPQTVSVAGSFNGWNATSHPLAPTGKPGEFAAEFTLPLGRHQYKLVLNGTQWTADPTNSAAEGDGMGGRQSLLEVAAPGAWDGWALQPEPFAPAPRAVCWRLLAPAGAAAPGELQAVLMGGNQVVAEWAVPPAAAGRIELTPARLASVRAASPDGVVRLLVRHAADGAGGWLRHTLYLPPAAPMGPEWRGRTIYFALTDRFRNGAPGNDRPVPVTSPTLERNPAVQYQGGDWAGLREKIEDGYFEQLGVGALWISGVNEQVHRPMQESVPPGHFFTAYHGYWPSHPTRTNPNFGSMDELRALVKAAHAHGIFVLLDLVAHHVVGTGDPALDHPWFTAHPEWFGPLNLPDGRKNIRLFDEHPFTTWFDDFLPAFDFGDNPAAIDAMTQNAVWWVKQTGVDGFRQDAVKHIVPEFWAALTRRLRDEVERPEGRRLYQVGETISSRAVINQFVSGEMLDGQFDFPLYWPLRAALAARTEGLDKLAGALRLSQAEYPDEALMSPLLGNHDVSRFMAYATGALRPDAADEKEIGWAGRLAVDNPQAWPRLAQAQALVLTLPGCPMLYYGDEIGLTGAQDPDNRRMMPWTGYTPEQQRALEQVRALGKLRAASPALKYGAYQELLATTDTLVFARVSAGRPDAPDQVLVTALHRGPALRLELALPKNLAGLAQAKLRFATPGAAAPPTPAPAPLTGSHWPLTLPADSAVVYELTP